MCQKCICDRDSAPDPNGGAYSTPLNPIAGFKRLTSKGKGGQGRGGEGRRGEGKYLPHH